MAAVESSSKTTGVAAKIIADYTSKFILGEAARLDPAAVLHGMCCTPGPSCGAAWHVLRGYGGGGGVCVRERERERVISLSV